VKEDYVLRRYTSEDFEEYVDLYKAVYSKDLDMELFLWKNKKNHDLNEQPLIYLIFNEDNKLIGANSFFINEIKYNNETYLGVQSGDTMVHKDYRGKGLFKKIIQYAISDLTNSGYKFIYGFANNQSYPGFVKLNFETMYQVNIYNKILNYKQFLYSKKKHNLFKAIGGGLDFISNLHSHTQDEIEITSVGNIDDELESFIANCYDRKYHFIKDENTIMWKYHNKPHGNYETVVLRKNNKIIAAFILRIDAVDELNKGNIVEYFISENCDLRKIIKVLCNYLCRNKKLDYMQLWDCGDLKFIEACKKNYFIKRNNELYLIVKKLDNDFSSISDIKMWHIVNGDADTA